LFGSADLKSPLVPRLTAIPAGILFSQIVLLFRVLQLLLSF